MTEFETILAQLDRVTREIRSIRDDVYEIKDRLVRLGFTFDDIRENMVRANRP